MFSEKRGSRGAAGKLPVPSRELLATCPPSAPCHVGAPHQCTAWGQRPPHTESVGATPAFAVASPLHVGLPHVSVGLEPERLGEGLGLKFRYTWASWPWAGACPTASHLKGAVGHEKEGPTLINRRFSRTAGVRAFVFDSVSSPLVGAFVSYLSLLRGRSGGWVPLVLRVGGQRGPSTGGLVGSGAMWHRGPFPSSTSFLEKRRRRLEKLEEQLVRLGTQATDKEEGKQVALGTSKLNYLDPRISIAWYVGPDSLGAPLQPPDPWSAQALPLMGPNWLVSPC